MSQTWWKGKQSFKRSNLCKPQTASGSRERRNVPRGWAPWCKLWLSAHMRVGLLIFPSDFRGWNGCVGAQSHAGCDRARPHGSLQELRAWVRQENPEGPMLLLRSAPGSGGAAALCDPLLHLFLRNYLGLALKRARTSWTNVWLFGVTFPCSSG